MRLVPPHKLVVIPNAIELETPPASPIDLRAELGVDRETAVVGTVGRLVPQKAPELFVRACGLLARRMPKTCFVLVGYGPLAPLVETEIKAAGIGDRFLLLQNSHDGPSLMEQFDVFALPSRYEAGATFAAMEAMRARTPVVVTDVVGNRDTVEDGTTGFVVPPGDAESLANAVHRLLADEALRQRMTEAAAQRFRARFDVRLAGENLGELYNSVVHGRRPRFLHTRS
jgi:glycosyltransferase involved in cell wall biosynthesis